MHIAAFVTDSSSTTDGDVQCHVNAQFISQGGVGKCVCNIGYDGNGIVCEGTCLYECAALCTIIEFLCLLDIDECNAGNNNCHPQARCCNIEGSFACICNEGYIGDGVKCCRRSNMISFLSRTRSISKSTRKRKHKP